MAGFLAQSRLELGAARDAPRSGNWRHGVDDGVAWLVLDRPEATTNTISEAVLRELAALLDGLEADPPRAVILRSGKAGGFAAGADINALAGMDAAAAETLLGEAHAVLDRLEGLACPTIAVVHGAALGAGFELALACDHRIAVEGASFGLPEVRLGLLPGLGGTLRLPALIEPTAAMRMMLTGSSAHTRKARELGIADLVVAERHVRAAIGAILRGEVGRRDRGLMARAFSLAPARGLAAGRMRSELRKKAPKDHYPAPHLLIDTWEAHGADPAAMRAAEISSFAELLQGATSRNLIRAFLLRQTLRKGAGDAAGIAHVHVVGAGIMGADIATWMAMQGRRVSVSDPDTAALGAMVRRAPDLCRDAHRTALETRDTLDRLMPDPAGYGLGRADLVIEAGPEKAEVKARIFADIAGRMRPDALLATNTSSLGLGAFLEHAPDATRFAGLHFFNPVSKVPLIEVVSHDRTSAATRARLTALCSAIGRLPVCVADRPGFLVNRALMPYLLEALLLLDEGVAVDRVDRAALRFGMPMGPVALADQVGLDICLDVAESLAASLDTPMADIPALLRDKVAAGHLGRKTGRGFHDWSNGPPRPAEEGAPDEALTDRLILPMVNACAHCLRTGVVGSPDEADAAMIYATGFAPFRGGPMQYARSLGHDEVHRRLEQLAQTHGPRFEPDAHWRAAG